MKTLERKFGQPQTIVAAHLEKLSNVPPLKMHNSESIISFASCISSLVAVLKSLGYEYDLKSTTVLNQVISKLPPNMKESWSLHSVKKCWRQPTVLDFIDWLRDKAEAHELMRVSQNKSRPEETPKTGFHKPPTKVFAAASKVEKPFYAPCLQCKGKHPLWSCSVFKEKTSTQRAQFSAQNRLCFACLQPDHMFRKCPKARKCTKRGCESIHKVLLHGAEKVFSVRSANKELIIAIKQAIRIQTVPPRRTGISRKFRHRT